MSRFGLCPIACALLLAACGEEPVSVVPEEDPAMAAALRTQLMVDPDLVGENRANSAAILPDPDGSIPAEDSSTDLVMAARADAAQLVGGAGRIKRAPPPREMTGGMGESVALTAAARAAASPGIDETCAEGATFTAAWAAKMPATFPVYPRAAVQQAAGSDEGGCALRAVNFTTLVPISDVIDFYYTRASMAEYSARHAVRGEELSLDGSKNGRRFAVYAVARDDGMTSVDLVTSGK